MAESIKKVIFALGPTASGKSAWALEQAQRTNGSIVNIDSVQFYKGLEVGSAAPTEAEKRIVPHYLYSYVEAPHEMTAGKYIEAFYKLLENPKLQFPIFIVGGTGFYIQALEKGLYDIDPIPEEIRKDLEIEILLRGSGELYQELIKNDPGTSIHQNDHYRIVRTLEIIRTTGKIPSQMKADHDYKKKDFPYPFIKVGFSFEKEKFFERVRDRTEKMIKDGIIEEAQGFLIQKQTEWGPLSSVGFKETIEFLREGKTKGWLQESIVNSTMKLIKKQKTWFKRDSSILWSDQSHHIQQFLHDD